jgi:hypothetical protein
MPGVQISEAAAPASRAVEKVRLFIMVMSLPFLRSAYERRRGLQLVPTLRTNLNAGG